jgi:hypothetical protein
MPICLGGPEPWAADQCRPSAAMAEHEGLWPAPVAEISVRAILRG